MIAQSPAYHDYQPHRLLLNLLDTTVGLDHWRGMPGTRHRCRLALVMTRLDTAAMNLFLAELGQAVAPGAHGIVLMDKAGWHRAGDLVVPENLSLVFLPPYSRELNPIERLWLHLRDNRLSHCVFQTTGEIVDTCCDAWNWLLGQTGRIRSLCSYPWLEQVSN